MKTIVIKEHTIVEDFLKDKELHIIDLGACQGEFSDAINQAYNLKRSILVEANPTNFRKLPKLDNYVSLNRAVSSVANLVIPFKEDMNSPYNGSLVFDYFKDGRVHDIHTVTLKELISLMNVVQIDILNVDIEGSEYDLFKNVDDSDLLMFKQITVEFHDFVDPSYRALNLEIEKRLIGSGFNVLKNRIEYKYGSDYYDTLFYKV